LPLAGIPLIALFACNGDDPGFDPSQGLMGQGLTWPFPNAQLIQNGRVVVPVGELALPDDASLLPVERLAWRSGFSPVQTSVIQLQGVDEAALPNSSQTETRGSVRLVDLDSGLGLPVFAELDAHPDARSDGDATLLIRPQQVLPVGHRIAVVVLLDAAPRPQEFQNVLDATGEWPDHYRDLVSDLASLKLGFSAGDIAVAWDFPISDGTAPMRSVVNQVGTPSEWSLDVIRISDEGADLAPGVWKRLEGTFSTTNFLLDDVMLDLAADGSVRPTGEVEADLYIHVPESVRGAEPGTVPVVIFAHGLLSEPSAFLDDDEDTHGVIALLDHMGAIAVATTWRGLTTDDRLHGIEVAGDFGRFNELTERATQGVANFLGLIALVQDGGLLDDPELGGLPDSENVSWYGISLGGTLGAVTLANTDRIDTAVLHVGGAAWSMMLERSAAWTTFEPLLSIAIPEPEDRQHLYALSQLFWDPVDPASYASELSSRPFMMQMAVGDDTVTNLASALLMRSTNWPLLTPCTTVPASVLTCQTPVQAPVVTQFDPLLVHPPDENRPGELVGSHTDPRTWTTTQLQTATFLATGEILHPCGDEACTAENASGQQTD
jgi:hypothetical protein